jgi:hypothetical protein
MARQQKAEKTDVAIVDKPVKSLFDRVAGYLDANDWNCHADQEKGIFDMRVGTKHVSTRVIIDTDDMENWQRVLVFGVFPVFVPENRRPAVLDAINRINYSMVYGNVEMDGRDGELRIRTVVEADRDLAEPLMERALHGNLNAANRYFAPLMAVAFGNAAPDTVLEMAAGQDEKTLQ